MQPVRELFAYLPAKEFGPNALKTVRARMVELGWSRKTVNAAVTSVRTVFKWAVSEELVAADVLTRLASVAGLQRGRTDAYDLEYRMRTADGRTAWLRERMHPDLDAEGRVRTWYGIAFDVTHRKRLEEETLRAQRLDAKIPAEFGGESPIGAQCRRNRALAGGDSADQANQDRSPHVHRTRSPSSSSQASSARDRAAATSASSLATFANSVYEAATAGSRSASSS